MKLSLEEILSLVNLSNACQIQNTSQKLSIVVLSRTSKKPYKSMEKSGEAITS